MYICEKCNFETENKNKYERHLTTQKHLSSFNGYIKTEDGHFLCLGINS